MAITLHLYYTGVDGAARRFDGEMISSGTVEKIRREPGNLKYEYCYEMTFVKWGNTCQKA